MTGDSNKTQFLKDYGDDYGYPNGPKNIDEIRSSEFKRLDGRVYLDHAGATLYSELQMEQVFKDLTSNLYGNPHSQSDISLGTSEVVREARQQVLDYCNASAKDYKCVFTSGATAALKLIGEAFPWSSQSCFMYTMENHNSVLGIREYALSQGSAACAIDVEESRQNAQALRSVDSLSSFKVTQYPVQRREVSTSCGKENEAAKVLKKTYFSGGTVSASISDIDFVKRRETFEESFEDGTASFLSIASIKHGFKILNTLTSSAISRHIMSLSAYTMNSLHALRHGNGAIVCTLYGRNISEGQPHFGSVVTFSLMRPDGSWVGHREVEKLASLSGIQLRTGCFCNPGACAKYLGLSHLDLLSNVEAGHACWDDQDIINGKPTGAVRVSFGYMSTYEDAKEFIDFIVKSFVSSPSYNFGNGTLLQTKSVSPGTEMHPVSVPSLKSIFLYPIKSCAGFNVEKWPLSISGLLYDREWIIRGVSGDILTQKKVPEMRLIRVTIDLSLKLLVAESPKCKSNLRLGLESDINYCGKDVIGLNNQRYEVHIYDKEINGWFSNAIGRPCMLLRLASSGNRSCLRNLQGQRVCRDVGAELNFVNEAQILLINEESICDLNNRLKANGQKGLHGTYIEVNPMRFRPNLVISSREPYIEDRWRSLQIGDGKFSSLGGCNRCQMINLDDEEEQILKLKEPLATLSTYRRIKGKILFGILLRYEGIDKEEESTRAWLEVGQEVYIREAANSINLPTTLV